MINKYNIFKQFEINKSPKYWILLYLIPIILLFWVIYKFSVNVPFWDQWELVLLFEKFATGNLNFNDLFTQHNEHRIIFPRIIFIILAFISNWNIKLEIWLSFFLVIITSLAIYKIASANQNQDRTLFHLFNLISLIVLFSLNQYENWLWGFQLAWFLINTCVVVAVLSLYVPDRWPASVRLFLSAICCFIASFSSAYGLLSWLALMPLVAAVDGNIRGKKIRTLLWIILFIICCSIYSIGYFKPTHHPSLFFLFQEPLNAVKYFLTLIGSFIGGSINTKIVMGAIFILNFLFFNAYCLKKSNSKLTSNAKPWLSLGWFPVLFAFLTTVGRAGFGLEQATSSRYITVLALLVVANLQMWRLLISDKWIWVRNKPYKLLSVYFLIGIITILFFFQSTNAISNVEKMWVYRTRAETCLEVLNFIDKSVDKLPYSCSRYIYPSPDRIRYLRDSLQKLGFRDFPNLENTSFVSPSSKVVFGYIDSPSTSNEPLTLPQSANLTMTGWAALPNYSQQPKAVFFSYGDNHSFFAEGLINLDRPDVAKFLKSKHYIKTGWQVNIPLSSIAVKETTIKAWIYDQANKRFVQLIGEPSIKIDG